MEVCVTRKTPACQDIIIGSGSSTDLSNSTYYSSKCLSMNDLKICLTEFAIVEEIEMPTNDFDLFPRDNSKCNAVREFEIGVSDNRKNHNPACEKHFSDHITFLARADPKSFDGLVGGENGQKCFKTSEVDESAESVNKNNTRSTLLPCDAIPSETPLKPVSAMKGSREKKCIEVPKKLSVTWAPDVYDPAPTSVSHVPSSKNQRGKKYGKNKNKGGGKSLRGSKGKDKKQARKSGGSSSKLKPMKV